MKALLCDLYDSRPVWWWRGVLVVAIFAVIGGGLVLSWRPRPELPTVAEGMFKTIRQVWPVMLGGFLLLLAWLAFRVIEQLREEDPTEDLGDFFELERDHLVDIDDEFPL